MNHDIDARRECHRGVVAVAAGRGRYGVRIRRQPSGACGVCSLAGLCSNSADDTLVLTASGPEALAAGAEVTVRASGNARRDAVVLLLAVPLAAMVGGAVAAQLLGGGEAAVALSALVAGAVAYAAGSLVSRRKVYWEITEIHS